MKRTTIILSVIVIVIIAAATIVESIKGTPFAHDNIYGTWWFLALWAAFAAAGTALVIKKKLYRRKSVFLIHLSFLVILLGALLSWTTAQSGTIHLRLDEATIEMKQMAQLYLFLHAHRARFLRPGTRLWLHYVRRRI